MKKLIFLLMFGLFGAFFATDANAQLLRTKVPTKDSLVSSSSGDTAYVDVSPTSNAAVAFHFTGTKVSGTVAGKVYLQASIDGTNYKNIDSATLSNVSFNFHTWEPSKLSYVKYRLMATSSGTCKIKPWYGYWLQRN